MRIRSVQRAAVQGRALAGKIALVTGASRGIGRATATLFARSGACCILAGLHEDEGRAVAAGLNAQGFAAEFQPLDVSDPVQVSALAHDIASRHKRVDVLVNNAGVFFDADRDARSSEVDLPIVERTVSVNVFGTIRMCTAFAPLIPHGGRIINVSSVMGQHSRRHDGLACGYRLSKAALNSYTQSLAVDLAPQGVMVDCYHPGWVKTALGGPQAEIEPEAATTTAFFLATRSSSAATGLFWWDCEAITW